MEIFIPAAVQQLFSVLSLLEPDGPLGNSGESEGDEEISSVEDKNRQNLIGEGERDIRSKITTNKEERIKSFIGEAGTKTDVNKHINDRKIRSDYKDLNTMETDSQSGCTSVFYNYLAEMMCGAMDRLKTLRMESNEIHCFMRTHRLLLQCDPLLTEIAYASKLIFSSASYTSSFISIFSYSSLSSSSSSSSLPSYQYSSKSIPNISHPSLSSYLSLSKELIQSAAYFLLEAIASLPPNAHPGEVDRTGLMVQTVMDLELPLISVSYFSTRTSNTTKNTTNDDDSSNATTVLKNVLSASISERTILAVLTQSVKYHGIFLLEKFSSQIIEKILGPQGWNFFIHGDGFSECVLLAKKKYFSTDSNSEYFSNYESCFQILLKLVFMVINFILEDKNGSKNISCNILSNVIKCFLPIFCDDNTSNTKSNNSDKNNNEKALSSDKRESLKTLPPSLYDNNTPHNTPHNPPHSILLDRDNVLLQLLNIDSSLQPHMRNKTLHSTVLKNTIHTLKSSNIASTKQITSALQSLLYLLSGFAIHSPRPLGNFSDDPAIVQEVNLEY